MGLHLLGAAGSKGRDDAGATAVGRERRRAGSEERPVLAVAIALGARSMSDIAVLAHQEPVLGAAPGDTTVRQTLELADPATLDKIARARAAVRAHVWQLICARPGGFPWLAVAGKLLAGWLVIDLDGTLITARSDKEGRAHLQDGLRLPAAEPARPTGPPRPRPRAEDQPHLALEGRLPGLLATAVRPARTRMTRPTRPHNPERRPPGAVGAGAIPSTSGSTATRQPATTAETRHNTISNRPRGHPESSRLTAAEIVNSKL